MKSSEFLTEKIEAAPSNDPVMNAAPGDDAPAAAPTAPKQPSAVLQGVKNAAGNAATGLGNLWNKYATSAGRQATQATSAANAATQKTVNVLLRNWMTATARLDPSNTGLYQQYFKDWAHRERTLRFADNETIEQAASQINPTQPKSITTAITSIFNNAMLARATTAGPERQEQIDKARKAAQEKRLADIMSQTSNLGSPDPSAIAQSERLKSDLASAVAPAAAPAAPKLPQVKIPGGWVMTKQEDGYWYDEQGDRIVNPDDVAELERRANRPPASAGAYVR
jgi:uncharacterized protein (DUF2267 family)